jgi:glutamate-1-semialdehyde 2,1-aminomutase
VTVNRVGSLLTLFFSKQPVTDYESAKRSNTQTYARFFQGMLEHGIYLAPSQFEATFVSLALEDADVEQTIESAAQVLPTLA